MRLVAAIVSLVVSPTVVHPGGAVRVTGNADGCPRGDTVLILSRAFSSRTGFAGVPALRARVRAGGAFATTGRIRVHAARGRYGVTARCGGGNLGVEAHVTVR